MGKTISSRVARAALPLALFALGACTQGFDAKVKRFQAELPAPAGQTYAVVADDPALSGGLEFAEYARLVDQHMTGLGYARTDPDKAQLIVRFDYGIDKGRERISSNGFAGDPFWNPWYGYRRFGYGGGYWGRPGYWGPHGNWGWGWYDPWMSNYDSYTVYTSDITLKIDRKDDGKRLFEGRAEAASTSSRLQYLVPNLVEAMFTEFPGHNGETVRITVAPEKKSKK